MITINVDPMIHSRTRCMNYLQGITLLVFFNPCYDLVSGKSMVSGL